MQTVRSLCMATVMIGVLAGLGVGVVLADEGPFEVAVVQSYNQEYIWCRNINQGIRDALNGLPVTYQYHYMDAKRRPGKDHLREAARRIAEDLRTFDPDVVVAVDDAAQGYLVVPHLKGRMRPQVVFCGVNAPISEYGYPAVNVSGVRERWHVREGYRLLKTLFPEARSVAFLIDDSVSAGYIIDALWEDYRQDGPFDLEIEAVEKVATFSQWKKRIQHYQENADALALGLYNSIVDDATGKVMDPHEVMAWTNSVNRLPTLGFSDVAMKDGLLCGVLESAIEQGYQAGQKIRRILLNGVGAGTLPVTINKEGIILVNLQTAEKHGFDIPYEFIEAAGAVIY